MEEETVQQHLPKQRQRMGEHMEQIDVVTLQQNWSQQRDRMKDCTLELDEQELAAVRECERSRATQRREELT